MKDSLMTASPQNMSETLAIEVQASSPSARRCSPAPFDAKKNGWWGTWLVPLVGASFMSPDRGWAGGPWLTGMQKGGLRLVERWTSRDELLDEQGEERKAWEMARGQKDRVQGK
jgi:hypothetical protein